MLLLSKFWILKIKRHLKYPGVKVLESRAGSLRKLNNTVTLYQQVMGWSVFAEGIHRWVIAAFVSRRVILCHTEDCLMSSSASVPQYSDDDIIQSHGTQDDSHWNVMQWLIWLSLRCVHSVTLTIVGTIGNCISELTFVSTATRCLYCYTGCIFLYRFHRWENP